MRTSILYHGHCRGVTPVNRQLLVSLGHFVIYEHFNIYEFTALGGKMKLAGKKPGKLGPVVEKKIIPVETDTQKLVNYVCGSNIYIKGEDIKVS